MNTKLTNSPFLPNVCYKHSRCKKGILHVVHCVFCHRTIQQKIRVFQHNINACLCVCFLLCFGLFMGQFYSLWLCIAVGFTEFAIETIKHASQTVKTMRECIMASGLTSSTTLSSNSRANITKVTFFESRWVSCGNS